MKNPLRGLAHKFTVESAMEDGWNYQHKPPALSPAKRKQLMEASALETPRSSLHAAFHIMKPYWTKASPMERATGAALLATSLFMTWYAVQVTVEFGNWQSALTNTVQQLFSTMMGARTGVSEQLLPQFPALKQALADSTQLNTLFQSFPDVSKIPYDPSFQTILKRAPDLAELLGKNPTMEQLFTAFPDMQKKLADNPAILEELRAYNTALSEQLRESPGIKAHLSTLMTLCGGDFISNIGHNISLAFNNVAQHNGTADTALQMMASFFTEPLDMMKTLEQYPLVGEQIKANPLIFELVGSYPDYTSLLGSGALEAHPEIAAMLEKNPTIAELVQAFPSVQEQAAQSPALQEQLQSFNDTMTDEAARERMRAIWHSNDLATIALKFTAMAIVSYKAAQYLSLRWRAWTTAYFTNKFTSFKAFDTMKRHFNNIDNPGQRIQEDPASFTAGMVSLTTGVLSAGMTLASFSGMLWGMGPLYGVPHGFFLLSAGYAAGLTALTVGAGWKLPWIQRNAQRREADLRKAIEAVNQNADAVAINGTEDVEKELVKKRLKPVLKNSIRDIGTQVKLIIVDATAGNLSIPIPWVVGAFAVASGAASMGTIQTINYAFNRVTGSLSFIVNRFGTLSAMKATADRMYMLDVAMDTAHYIEEEKRQAAQKALPAPGGTAPGVK